MYTQPIFVSRETEVQNPNDKLFYVFPIKYTDGNQKMLLYNFPSHIQIFIYGFFIQPDCFDYLNPLCTGYFPIRFYDITNLMWVEQVDCNRIFAGCLNMYFPDIAKNIVYYPGGYSIHYMNKKIATASPQESYTQMCDVLNKKTMNIYSTLPSQGDLIALPTFPANTTMQMSDVTEILFNELARLSEQRELEEEEPEEEQEEEE